MSREVRRVPEGWAHPRNAAGHFIPLLDEDYESAAQKWATGFLRWESGDNPDRARSNVRWYWDWVGNPPSEEQYRPAWPDEDRTWYQAYETVSEGTPTTPAFATAEELIEHLVAHGESGGLYKDPWPRVVAEEFVRTGWRGLFLTAYTADSEAVPREPLLLSPLPE